MATCMVLMDMSTIIEKRDTIKRDTIVRDAVKRDTERRS